MSDTQPLPPIIIGFRCRDCKVTCRDVYPPYVEKGMSYHVWMRRALREIYRTHNIKSLLVCDNGCLSFEIRIPPAVAALFDPATYPLPEEDKRRPKRGKGKK